MIVEYHPAVQRELEKISAVSMQSCAKISTQSRQDARTQSEF